MKNACTILLLSCLLFKGMLYSQDHASADPESLATLAEHYFSCRQYDSAAFFYYEFLDYLGNTHLDDSVDRVNPDSRLRIQLKLGVCLLSLGRYDSCLAVLERGILSIQQTGNLKDPLIADFYFQAANCNLLKGDQQKAIMYYSRTLESRKDSDPWTAMVLMNMGDICFAREDFELAVIYFRKALIILSEDQGPNRELIYRLLINTGSAYLEQNDAEKALFYYTKAESMQTPAMSLDPVTAARFFLNMGSIWFRKCEYRKALSMYNKAGIAYYNSENVSSSEQILLAMNTASTYSMIGSEDSCSLALIHALTSFSHDPVLNPAEISRLYCMLARSFSKQMYWMQSFNCYDYALSLVVNDKSNEVHSGPDALARIIDRFRILSGKASVLYEYGCRNPSERNCLEEAFAGFSASVEMLDSISPGFFSDNSLMLFNTPVKDMVVNAVNAGLDCCPYPGGKNAGYLFELSEKARGKVLQRKMSVNSSMRKSAIPSDIPGKLDKLRDEQTQLLVKHFSDGSLFTEAEKRTTAHDFARITDITLGIDSLNRRMEAEFPGFKKMRNRCSGWPPDTISKYLDKDEMMVEYLMGDSTLVIFLVSRDSTFIEKVRTGRNFYHEIGKFVCFLNEADIEGTYSKGHLLYTTLISPILRHLKGKRKLIIVPDDIMMLIPFESLITNEHWRTSSGERHFLIEDFEISYHFSASIWMENQRRMDSVSFSDEISKGFTGYAPDFSSNFNDLPGASEEISLITELFSGHGFPVRPVLGSAATKQDFLEHASAFSLIHLATHSSIDPDFPVRSGLIFAGKKDSLSQFESWNGILSQEEIVNLKLDSTFLVVLSACATGTGKVIRSEGVMSLARCFVSAGAENVIYSLWNITDRNTRDFMRGFYSSVLEGNSYSAALRKQKLRMISNPATAIPSIWAPYVLVGNQ